MITVSCAACGESLILNDNSLSYITPIGLVQNLCGYYCLKIYNNSDFIINMAKTINSGNENQKHGEM